MVLFDKVLENIPTKFIVYFLIRDDYVVYIGSSKMGLTRAYNHNDIDYDKVGIIYCTPDNYKDIEAKYILQYTPMYNRKITGNMFSLQNAKAKIKNEVNKKFNLVDLKRIMRMLSIEPKTMNSNCYISGEDFDTIVQYIRRRGI